MNRLVGFRAGDNVGVRLALVPLNRTHNGGSNVDDW